MEVTMTALDRARARAAAQTAAGRGRVVFPEGDDPRIRAAMDRLDHAGLATPVPLAPVSDGQLAALLKARALTEGVARRMLARPLIRAAAMVAAGEAEAMVAGADSPTRRVIEAAGLAIGLADGVSVPSSFFLMLFPDGRELVMADCAVNPEPDATDLAAIATASAASARALLGVARVALLSYATGTSGAGPGVERVRTAAGLTGFAGPVQADAALNPRIAALKGLGSGDANVLIFPSLDAGNIAYKLCQELAGAQAVGPFLQGFRQPVCDLSRGATTDDIVASTVVTLAMAGTD
jgi:phosphate acetyltransferase